MDNELVWLCWSMINIEENYAIEYYCTYLFSLILNWCTVSELIITDLSYFVFNDFSDRFD